MAGSEVSLENDSRLLRFRVNHCNLKVMRILYVADGRSPIALNWMSFFVDRGHEVHLASTFACEPDLALASLRIVPVALSEFRGGGGGKEMADKGGFQRLIPVGARTRIRQWVGPLTLPKAARVLRQVIAEVQPDLVHAMRIPYEGMLAAMASGEGSVLPLLLSVWGNDFTLHAPSTPLMRRYTHLALHRADALHTDCYRDQRLAQKWGFDVKKPAVVLPGGGGVQRDIFYPAPVDERDTETSADSDDRPVIINPRGFRAYVRNDTFFQAIPLILAHKPQARFICPAMAGEAQAHLWLENLGVSGAVDLLPHQTREKMADLFRRSQIVVSVTTHDGTPNTLLEALACGCFPVVGDIESLREWITPEVNGFLVDPSDPNALARAVVDALEQPELRARACGHNLALIAARAEYGNVMAQAEAFYSQLAGIAQESHDC